MMRQQDDCDAIVELVRPSVTNQPLDAMTRRKRSSDPVVTDQLQDLDGGRSNGTAVATHFDALLESFHDLAEESTPEDLRPSVLYPEQPSPWPDGGVFSTGLDALLDGLDSLAEKSALETPPPVTDPEPLATQTEDTQTEDTSTEDPLGPTGLRPVGGRRWWTPRQTFSDGSDAPVVSLRAELGAPEIGAMVAVALITAGLWPLMHQAALVVPGGVLLWFTLPPRAPFFHRASPNEDHR